MRSRLEAALAPGERIVWSDRPRRGGVLGAVANALGLGADRAYAFTSSRRGLILEHGVVLAFDLPPRTSISVLGRPGAEFGTIDLGEVELGPPGGPREKRRVWLDSVAYPWSVLESVP